MDLLKHCQDHFSYDPVTGYLIRTKNTKYGKGPVGIPIRCVSSNGYRRVHIIHKTFKVHNIAWLMYYGEYPKNIIDHINGDKLDNRIENLRHSSPRGNDQNRVESRKGKLCGAFEVKNGYVCRYTYKGKSVYVKQYPTELEAHEAYKEAIKWL